MTRMPRSRAASCIGSSATSIRLWAGLAEGETPAEATLGANGFGKLGYLGPAPPAGHGPHRYVFRLLTVDQPVALPAGSSYQQVEAATAGHVLAEARLIGSYQQ